MVSNKWNEVASQVIKIKQAVKYYQEMEKVYLDELKVLSDHTSCRNENYIFEIATRPGPVDYSKIPQLSGVSLEPYRKAPVDYCTLKETAKLPEGMETL